MGVKLRELTNEDGTVKTYLFWCPGCRCAHPYEVPRWSFNGSLEKPSFTPSLMCNQHDDRTRCHLFVTEGQIIFCSDCHHDLKGRTVEMSDWNEDCW